jgi:molybdenum cofactor cytidylyltransferase
MIEIDKDIEAVIITLADQYLIGSPEIDSLIDKYRNTEKPIIASRYNRIWGVPALFARETFDELFALEGDMGARDVIKDFEVLKVGTVDMLEAEFDMDTPDDLERLDEVQ